MLENATLIVIDYKYFAIAIFIVRAFGFGLPQSLATVLPQSHIAVDSHDEATNLQYVLGKE